MLAKSTTVQARNYPRHLDQLATHIRRPDLPLLLRQFLYEQLHPDAETDASDLAPELLPQILSRISVYHSAVAIYHAPSDLSGVGGMHKERIRSTPSWHGSQPRYDCVFAEKDAGIKGFDGLYAARVLLFLSFEHLGIVYPCALVNWFSPMDDRPCPLTRMWIVEPDVDIRNNRIQGIIHIDSILRNAHLLPVYGDDFIPTEERVNFQNSLNLFKAYYINKYADHHSHEVAF